MVHVCHDLRILFEGRGKLDPDEALGVAGACTMAFAARVISRSSCGDEVSSSHAGCETTCTQLLRI